MIPANTVQIQGQGSVTADQLNTYLQGCTIAAQLRQFPGLTGMTVFMQGTSAVNDGNAGAFYWNHTSSAPDDGVNTIVPSGVAQGAWLRLLVPTTGIRAINPRVFTVSGTYVPTAGLVAAIIYATGGGAGGGGAVGATSNLAEGGGGGAGSTSIKIATAGSIGGSQAVTIGGGGGGGASGNNAGSNGGDTSVGSLCIGKGGSGGGGAPNGGAGAGGNGGVAGTGDVTIVGAPGQTGHGATSLTLSVSNQLGGASAFGGPAAGNDIAGFAGTGQNASANTGAGGNGGAAQNVSGNAAGGNGGSGVVFIIEFLS